MTPQEIERNLHAASRAISAGDIATAERLLAPLEHERICARDWALLTSVIRRGQGSHDEAREILKKALKSFPGDSGLLTNLGNTEHSAGRPAEAMAAFRKAARAAPEDAQVWLNLGIAAMEQGEAEEAETAASRSAALSPSNPAPFVLLGNAQRRQGRTEEALTAYDRALALQPGHVLAAYCRAVALAALGRNDEAIEGLTGLLRMAPDLAAGHFALANSLRDSGRPDDAAAAYRKAIELEPELMDAHHNLNQMLWMSGQHDTFLDSYRQAIVRRPLSASLKLAYAEQLLRIRSFEAADDVLAELSETPEAPPRVLAMRGLIARQQHEFGKGREFLAAAYARAPEDRAIWRNFAVAQLQTGEIAGAIDLLRAYVARHKLDQRGLACLATALQLAGDLEADDLLDVDRCVRVQRIETPPGYASLGEYLAELRAALNILHGDTRFAPLDQSLVGGSQVSDGVFDPRVPALAALEQALSSAITSAIGSLQKTSGHPFLSRNTGGFQFQGVWSVRLLRGGHHHNHVHQEGWLSSAFYVSVPGVEGNEPEGAGWLTFGEPGFDLPVPLPPRFAVRPEPGLLALFPSYFWHGTIPFSSVDERITVAFDALPA